MQAEKNLDKNLYEVRDCPVQDAFSLIEKHHYSKGGTIAFIYAHGLYERNTNILMGAACWSMPMQDVAMSVNPTDWRLVLNLTRLVCLPEAPRNSASFLLGKSISLIKKDKRYKSLVTFADEARGHVGGIYKATNWLYMGRVGPHQIWQDPKTGRQVSNAHKSGEELYAVGYIRLSSFYKHKYIMHLNEKEVNNKMQLSDLVKPLEDMSEEELKDRLRAVRDRRENIRPARQKIKEKAAKKESKKKVSAVEKLLEGLSPADLEALLKGMQ